MLTILYGARDPFESPTLLVEPGAIGWEAKPEGLCRGESCVPFPVTEGRIDLAAFAERLGQPFACEGDIWAFGEPRRAAGSLLAPDFTLPDLDGDRHSLSQYRGKKVLLVSWASW